MATLLEVYSTPLGVPTWTAVAVPQAVVLQKLVAHAKGGIPTLAFAVRGGALPGLPDPWLGKTVRLTVNGTLRFVGDVTRLDTDYHDGLGWLRPYSAFGLRNRGDWLPHTDTNNGSDSSAFNLSADNQGADYLPSRAGRTVGQILVDVLEGADNSAGLAALGLVNYTSAGTGAAATAVLTGGVVTSATVTSGGTNYTTAPTVLFVGGGRIPPTTTATGTATVSGGAITGITVTSGGSGYVEAPTILVSRLPASTLADLAAMSFQPPGPCYFGGEKLLGAAEGFLSTWAPNHILWVQPDGTLRFLDTRTYTNHTFTLGTDRVRPSGVSRDLSECYQRVVVRGQQIAEMYRFSTKLGTLSESPFAHDALTVAQAKAAWVPDDYFRPEKDRGRVEGTCTCPSTTTVTVTSAIGTTTFAANEWDQTATGRHGWVSLTYAAGTDILTMQQRYVVSNTAMTAGSTATLTLDRALPHLLFDHFTLTGLTKSASAVWIDYQLPAWAAPKVARQSTYPFPLSVASGAGATMTSTATGIIRWSSSGNPPYQEGASAISVDAGSGIVRFNYPTRLTAGKQPDDVEVWVPIYTGVNAATWPADTVSGGVTTRHYAGTSNTVDGLTKTLTVTVSSWRDPSNQVNMLEYAKDMLDSVKDAVCEGVIQYLGLYEPALAPGTAYSVTGASYTTGWEGLSLANVETELAWNADGLTWLTSIRVSNRRAHFSAEAFLHPDRTGVTFDWGDASIDMTPQGIASGLQAERDQIIDTLYRAQQTKNDIAARSDPGMKALNNATNPGLPDNVLATGLNVNPSGLNVAPPAPPPIPPMPQNVDPFNPPGAVDNQQ